MLSHWKVKEVMGVRMSKWQAIGLDPATILLSGLVMVTVCFMIVKTGRERSLGARLFESLSLIFWSAYMAALIFSYYRPLYTW
jgi:hypothetical protein